MNDKYILEGHEPVIEPDLMKWAKWFETANRRVAEDVIGESRVSTVFIGLDHSFGIGKKPLLFETIVFGGNFDGELERYSTWEEAELGHKKMVKKLENPNA